MVLVVVGEVKSEPHYTHARDCRLTKVSMRCALDANHFTNNCFSSHIDQLKHLTRSVFRHAAHQNTAMWLENNVRFSTGSTIARSNIAMSVINEGDLSTPGPYIPSTPTTPTTPGYRDSSWA